MNVTACIPTIPSRRSLLSRCLWSLPSGVEVLVADGDRPMGDKLNAMFAAAATTHVVCVDDDDLLLPSFGWDITRALECDFIGYRILYTEDGQFRGSVAHRGQGDTSWSTYDRGVSPKCLVRTEVARAYPFGNHYTADREWSMAVQQDIETHHFIDAELYHYDHWNAHMVGTEPDDPRFARPQRDVGTWPYDEGRVTWLAMS